jgi:predicted CXXCH cytochrome family protein
MRVRLRHLTTRSSGSKAVREQIREVGRLRIGRGSGNDVELAGLTVALDHATIEQRDGRIWVEAVGGSELRVGGHVSSGRAVASGDVVRIGQYELRLLEPGPGEDLVVEVEAIAHAHVEGAGLLARSPIGPPVGPAALRAICWCGALLFVGLAAALPSLGPGRSSGSERETNHPAIGSQPSSLVATLAAAWNPGPLAAAHAHVAENCRVCHAAPFERVGDGACLECHSAIGRHVASETALDPHEPDRCGSCHVEHGGSRALAHYRDALCVGCHGQLQAVSPETGLADVRDFLTDHPEFRPAVVVEPGSERRVRMDLSTSAAGEPPAKERSGLVFPHDEHLKPRLRAPAGEVTLACADCHRLERAGATMNPIRFEDHCQRCHSLAFDERHPEREAPHDSPDRVERALLEFYATTALLGEASDPDAPPAARRRPGRELAEPERLTVLAWARDRAQRSGAVLLAEGGVCDQCHDLASSGGASSVMPVRIVPFPGADRWLSFASFAHRPHGPIACDGCHDARSTRNSETVMLPGIESCRACHGGDDHGFGRVSSPCVLCHSFHRSEHGAMRPQSHARGHGGDASGSSLALRPGREP